MKAGTCKHYNGDFHNERCEAGVCYRDVTTEPDKQFGSAFRKPCVISWPGSPLSESQQKEFDRRGKCDKYTEPTKEEIAEYEAGVKKHLEQFKLSIPLISKAKREHKGKNWRGVEVCPVCGNELFMRHAACNGHVWGQCKTEGCLSWME